MNVDHVVAGVADVVLVGQDVVAEVVAVGQDVVAVGQDVVTDVDLLHSWAVGVNFHVHDHHKSPLGFSFQFLCHFAML